ncbi:MAG TPA: hypothetical protein PLJ00_04975 [Chitinophagales bacterium]|nr:hypothetical protein [Chitinophagales bacterium]
MKKITSTIFTGLILCSALTIQAQTEVKKFSLNGTARTLSFLDNLSQDVEVADTITAPKSLSSHTLVDLGMLIRPGDNIAIQSSVRIRNDFGGFWGSGVTFDVRELYVKGVVKDVVRYQVGDVHYKLTPYTFYNNDSELSNYTPGAFSHLLDQVSYDNFYLGDNTWRQQGAAVDFGVVFNKYVQEINWNVFTGRVAATNGGNQPERLFSAANMTLIQSKYVSLGVNYANFYDFPGTASTTEQYVNPVVTGNAQVAYTFGDIALTANGEMGKSHNEIKNDSLAPVLDGNFFDTKIEAKYTPWQLGIYIGMKSVGADFRSAGAQTKRINFDGTPAAYERITNDQILRETTMFDLLREADLYNLQLQNGLMAFDARYDNITPYGAASPNRQGFEVGLNWVGCKEAVKLNASFLSQSEIRGQGTLNLRNFARMDANATIAINKLVKWKKSIELTAGMRSDNTSRDGEAGVPSVELQTDVLSVGFSANIVSDLDIVLGLQQHTYAGFEFVNQTDKYDQIINFTEYTVDGSQQMIGGGLRWNFSEKTYLMGQFNQFSQNNNLVDDVLPSYTINNFAFIYSMQF